MKIKLTKNYTAIIDKEDFDTISKYRWFADVRKRNVYAKTKTKINGFTRTIYMHRLIMGLDRERLAVDHKNHNGLDNRRKNIRVCSYTQNNINRIPCAKHGKGIEYRYGKYRVSIGYQGRKLHLGSFDSLEEARKVRQEKEIELYGEFAYARNL